jgi:RNA-binding protein with serine-rich domain 1
MHEAQLDGSIIHVSIVLPRRKVSPSPPLARRGPRGPPANVRPVLGAAGGGPPGVRGWRSPGAGRYGYRSDVYRPRSVSRSRSRSRSPLPPPGGSRRYRSRSRSASYSSRSRSRSPPGRGGGRDYRGGGRGYGRRRSPSRDSYDSYYDRRSRSPSRSRDWDRR